MGIEKEAKKDQVAEDYVHPFHEAAAYATSVAMEPEAHYPTAFVEAMAHLVPGG